MGGTRAGGIKAREKNKELYGEDYYQRIGRDGGRKSKGGFAAMDRERVREIGRKGGSAPKVNKKKIKKDSQYEVIKEAAKKRKWLIF